jgi:hypothetical protein
MMWNAAKGLLINGHFDAVNDAWARGLTDRDPAASTAFDSLGITIIFR